MGVTGGWSTTGPSVARLQLTLPFSGTRCCQASKRLPWWDLVGAQEFFAPSAASQITLPPSAL